MAELLIELFSEEIPARMQLGAARDFARLFDNKLKAYGIDGAIIKTYVSPRRLVLLAQDVPVEQAAISEEVKGPREGAPQQALDGFLRKTGLSLEQLAIENGIYLARIEKPSRKTKEVLPDILDDILRTFPWPKSMRWGTGSFRWVRPLKSILFLFDGNVVPFEIEGVRACDVTYGHRFLSSGQAIKVADFAGYIAALEANSVILDHEARQTLILEQAKALCQKAGLELMDDQGLLEEVAGLNEYPTALLGDMDPNFLTLPPEVIKTSMRTHQKYFAVRDAKTGKMAPHFIIVSNMQAADGGAEIKRGNAKVLSARLSDGVFFWNEDNKVGNFDRWNEKLNGVTFHAKLGTMAQRVARIEFLASFLAEKVGAEKSEVKSAANLCKADLASYMVGEFPELQGVMGGYYAEVAQMDNGIATAIREHYRPQGPSDALPSTLTGAIIAIADKLDTLIGFFAIGEKPTGSKDPYALRRSALGVVRILNSFNLRFSLSELCNQWGLAQNVAAPNSSEIIDFFKDRIKVQWKEDGFDLEAIDAVLAVTDDDILNMQSRLVALNSAIKSEAGDDILAAFKRANNILMAEAKKSPLPEGTAITLGNAPAVEIGLLTSIDAAKKAIESALLNEDYNVALSAYGALRSAVDSFLDGVLVNAEEPEIKVNRLLILRCITELCKKIADLSKFK